MIKKSEPPSSCRSTNLFRIGKDNHGRWIVQDDKGLCGGLFIDRASALKFAMFENGHRPQAVIMVPDVLELDLTATAHSDVVDEPRAVVSPLRRAA